MKSIISNSTQCYICGGVGEETHHCIGGTAKRSLSEKYGLTVRLCSSCHDAIHHSPHKFDRDMYNWLHQIAQERWEETYGTREEFIKIFKRSYL